MNTLHVIQQSETELTVDGGTSTLFLGVAGMLVCGASGRGQQGRGSAVREILYGLATVAWLQCLHHITGHTAHCSCVGY